MPNLSLGSQKLILRQECLNDQKNKQITIYNLNKQPKLMKS